MATRLLLALLCSLGISETSVRAGDFLVTAVTARAVPEVYEGPCPTNIRFEGTITANGAGRVEYAFQTNGGGPLVRHAVQFKSRGSQTVAFNALVNSRAGENRWLSLVVLSPNPFESARASFTVKCDERPAPPGGVRGSTSNRNPFYEGRFRVTINGFECGRPTFDDERQTDGVDDEIFVRADAALYDGQGRRRGESVTAISNVIGDTNGFPNRIRGGSGRSVFGGNGGFKEGDAFPSARPWERRSVATTDRPPLLAWEGELRQSDVGLLIVPSLWEWDGNADLEHDYSAALANFWEDGEVVSRMRRTVSSYAGEGNPLMSPAILRRLFAGVKVSQAGLGDPKNRPIGMKEGRGDFHLYEPQALVLSFLTASVIANQNRPEGRGVIKLGFQDSSRFRGVYQLYIQIERIP